MSNATSLSISQKVVFHPNSTYVEDFGTRAWCYEFFPPAILILTYLLTCMAVGGWAMGIVYLKKWWRVPLRCDPQGKLESNRLMDKHPSPDGSTVEWGNQRQLRLMVFSTMYFLMSVAVVITGLAYIIDPSVCIHVFVFMAYYALCGLTLLGQSIIFGMRWWVERRRRLAELDGMRRAVEAEYARITRVYFETPRPTQQVFW
eukprot:GGOE01044435.1.p2 GENE.GGOE01044435.1~~GGOE01044435.1.p2  ORF type:complete len:228 (+),score=56.48 GGOE01044435.1:81-686(+)